MDGGTFHLPITEDCQFLVFLTFNTYLFVQTSRNSLLILQGCHVWDFISSDLSLLNLRQSSQPFPKVNFLGLDCRKVYLLSPFQLEITASVCERPLLTTWSLLLWPTWLATAVRKPTLLFVIGRGSRGTMEAHLSRYVHYSNFITKELTRDGF